MESLKGAIRLATLGDANQILELYNSDDNVRGDDSLDYELADIEDYLTKDINKLFVYEIEGHLVGACLIEVWSTYCYFHTMIVSLDYQGKGVGSALMDHIEAYLQQVGISLIESFTEVENVRMQHLFEKKGYEKGKQFIFYSKDTRDQL